MRGAWPSRAFARATALASVCALLAGCTAASDDTALADPVQDPAALQESLPAPLVRDLALPGDLVAWENGTAGLEDECYSVCDYTLRDLRPYVPAGVPAELRVTMTYDPADAPFSMDIWFEGDGLWWDYRWQYAGDQVTHYAMVTVEQEIAYTVVNYGPGSAPEVPYTLKIEVRAHANATSPGVPTAVPLQTGDVVSVSTLAGEDASYMLFDPQDTLLGTFDGEYTVPAGGLNGTYVVLGARQEADVTDELERNPPLVVRVPGGGALVTMRTRVQAAPSEDSAGGGPFVHSFPSTTAPVAVGFQITTPPAALFLRPGATSRLDATLTGPDGTVLAQDVRCNPACAGPYGVFIGDMSPLGAPGLVPGTYELTLETRGTTPVRVTMYGLYFERAS